MAARTTSGWLDAAARRGCFGRFVAPGFHWRRTSARATSGAADAAARQADLTLDCRSLQARQPLERLAASPRIAAAGSVLALLVSLVAARAWKSCGVSSLVHLRSKCTFGFYGLIDGGRKNGGVPPTGRGCLYIGIPH